MSKHEHNPLDNFEFGGRLYVSMSHRPSISFNSPTILSGLEVHQETADLANIGVTERDSVQEEGSIAEEYSPAHPPIPIDSGNHTQSPILAYNKPQYSDNSSLAPLVDSTKKFYASTLRQDKSHDLEVGPGPNLSIKDVALIQSAPSKKNVALRAASYLPAVFLGTLLNVLDALSYGMIMFPLGEAVFSQMAPTGLSMFYISTVISQLVYSCGLSAFKSGIGSEMIEVTPFFHSMALSIAANMAGKPDEAILATVIVTYAFSSIVTGVIFFLLGKLKLGSLVGFFPRHILVGCIGGVGYFLVVTGIEVSSRLEGGLLYNAATFKYLFGDSLTLMQWIFPLILTVILILLHQKIHHSLLVPMFFIGVFIAFHVVVALVGSWNLGLAREYGWVFPAVQNKEPWYSHYQLFRFNLVDWFAILREFPSMLALTFFGILHVPINVPALAVSIGMDQFDVDRELVAHGYSNAISGLLGLDPELSRIHQFRVVYQGWCGRSFGRHNVGCGDRRRDGNGPVVIGYIPVCVVGSLIYLLGYELLKEAIYDTWGKLRKIEYTTIIIIVVVMGAWDFVYGILAGILLACLSFVVQAARRPVVQDIYTGKVARSTVLRHPKQQEFLKDVGNQICVIKLQGSVFFGSIGGVEHSIRDIFEKTRFRKNPIKYLIIDMKGVFSIDFSAAEGFRRILNLTNEFGTQLIIASVEEDDDIVNALRDAGLWDTACSLEIQLFNDLNYALEWCENSFLKTYNKLQVNSTPSKQIQRGPSANSRHGSPMGKSLMSPGFDIAFGTPRTTQGMTFYDTGANEPSFFILESGLVRSVFKFESEDRELPSSILPNTAFGDLLELSEYRRSTYTAVNDTVAWRLTAAKVKELVKTSEGQLVFNELLIVQTKLMKERFDTLSANLVILA
ncbi:hypothetical protein HF325_004048 [Metschnikowia pulcherrima]|uniref:STAS domain-containing protein n=1 Tax=Metschnikowia pulcherrima TaxID=27326 RepID=A0A8H7GR81_9ASCO|nr:hypothetical protein HF325_004048 [Metschnikowia pulcherrima]